MPGEVDRYNMRRFLSLTANVEGEDLGRAIGHVERAIKAAGKPPKGVEVDMRGQVKPMLQMFTSLEIGLSVAVIVILIMLTAYFQSFRLALTAVASVPAVLAGVVLALYATRTTLNIESFMGAIMAVGVVQPGGGTGGRPLFVLEQTDPVRIFVGVPELAAGFIKDEDTALIRIQAVPGAFRRGKIVRSGFSLNPSSRTLPAEIDVPNTDGHFRPGIYVTVTITIDRDRVFAVPSSSFVFLGGQSYALDLILDGKVVRTPVLIGPSDDRFTEILRKKGRAGQGEDWIMPDGSVQLATSDGAGGSSPASSR